MIQLSLIDWAETNARASDPQTSKDGAAKVSLKGDGLRALFVMGIKRLGGKATAKEISEAMSNNNVKAESIRKRAKECCDLGMVEVVGTRKCKVSGENCQVYSVKQTPRAGVTYRISKQDTQSRTVEVFADEDGTLMAQDVSRAPHEFGYLTPVSDLWAYEFKEVIG
jgi:hypothetical protein